MEETLRRVVAVKKSKVSGKITPDALLPIPTWANNLGAVESKKNAFPLIW